MNNLDDCLPVLVLFNSRHQRSLLYLLNLAGRLHQYRHFFTYGQLFSLLFNESRVRWGRNWGWGGHLDCSGEIGVN